MKSKLVMLARTFVVIIFIVAILFNLFIIFGVDNQTRLSTIYMNLDIIKVSFSVISISIIGFVLSILFRKDTTIAYKIEILVLIMIELFSIYFLLYSQTLDGLLRTVDHISIDYYLFEEVYSAVHLEEIVDFYKSFFGIVTTMFIPIVVVILRILSIFNIKFSK